MSFELSKYAQSKIHVTGLIKASHDWQQTEGFIADGAICPQIFEQQEHRILCILGESYGYDECGVTDIEHQLANDVIGVGEPKRWTAKRLPSLLWLLHQSFEKGSIVSWEEFPELCTITSENTAMLQSALSKSAWVNVKKASKHVDKFGGDATRMDYGDVYASAVRNKDVLREQIASLNPTLIIICGASVFNGLHDAGLLGSNLAKGKKGIVQKTSDFPNAVEVSHPGYHTDWGYEGIYTTYLAILSALTT